MERIHQKNYFYLFQLLCYRIYFLPPLQKSSIRVSFYPCYFPFTSGCRDSNSSQQSSRVPAFFFIVELRVEVQIFLFWKDKYFSGFFYNAYVPSETADEDCWETSADNTLHQPACSPVLQRDHVFLCFTIFAFLCFQHTSGCNSRW